MRWLALLLAVSSLAQSNPLLQADVCVFGGTSGGVIAAVQAARMGKTSILVATDNHLGGMTSGGLGETDIGKLGDAYIQGLAREFYVRVGTAYGGSAARFRFEPHVAENVFFEMALQAGVKLVTNVSLTAVKMEGQRIATMTLSSGWTIRAPMYIDASYEGDLMAKTGVSYTIGREGTNVYHEQFDGVRPPNSGSHQFGALEIDPYRVPKDPKSGLLPLISSERSAAAGQGDPLVQAFNFRLCLTRNGTNRLALTAPPNYSASRYELLARYIAAMQSAGRKIALATFMNISAMPNGKTDINNNGPVSTDFIGASTPYIEADQNTRREIWQAHKDYLQGFLYFLSTDSRVPAEVRESMSAYGLCRDEFRDTGGWPYQLYVREARRMVSDYVMTESNCLGLAVAPDSIGLAAYAMDSHNCQRIVLDGRVQNEGDTYGLVTVPAPYPISYRSIVPKAGQCENLLVPWCVSSSHIAFGSIRMEPVFMVLAQSAGTAACMAIRDHVSVQRVNVAALQARLRADGQALEAPPPPRN